MKSHHSLAQDNEDATQDGNSSPSCTDPKGKGTSDESDHTHSILTHESSTHSLPEANNSILDPHSLAHDNHCPCVEDCASTSKHSLLVCPSTLSVATDRTIVETNVTSSENTPSTLNAHPPT